MGLIVISALGFGHVTSNSPFAASRRPTVALGPRGRFRSVLISACSTMYQIVHTLYPCSCTRVAESYLISLDFTPTKDTRDVDECGGGWVGGWVSLFAPLNGHTRSSLALSGCAARIINADGGVTSQFAAIVPAARCVQPESAT